jgi:hypothetical protein
MPAVSGSRARAPQPASASMQAASQREWRTIGTGEGLDEAPVDVLRDEDGVNSSPGLRQISAAGEPLAIMYA